MPQLILADRIRMIDLVAQNQKRRLVEILHTQQRIQFCLALCEPLGVLRIYQEDDAGDFGEVIAPEAACCGSGRVSLGDMETWRGLPSDGETCLADDHLDRRL